MGEILLRGVKKIMYVLSLCDGIGGGRIALHRANIKVDRYFASEIDKNAIKCADDNWNDIIHIGDIRNVSYKDGILYTEVGNYELSHVDLLMSGTPCQSFSLSNMYNNTGLEGKSGLFLEALRILKEVKPKRFFFENVRMSKKNKQILDDYLGVCGIEINSNLVSFQNRPRIYWTNIPYEMPSDKHISFQEYKELDRHVLKYKLPKSKYYLKMWHNGSGNNSIMGGCYNVTNLDKVQTITTEQRRCPNAGLIECEDFCRILSQNELEYAQTLPHGYTRNFSYNRAQKLIGNGWTIDVIAHIFSYIKND